ncbi:hypothetical protein EDB84DRAFT_372520 [Lactarius hengduanensis]|nr:hypothetical protein EDB84DRAFT_372520 [Lactarius hengduanensis]
MYPSPVSNVPTCKYTRIHECDKRLLSFLPPPSLSGGDSYLLVSTLLNTPSTERTPGVLANSIRPRTLWSKTTRTTSRCCESRPTPPTLPQAPAHVDDPPLFDPVALEEEIKRASNPPLTPSPAALKPKPKARIVSPHTDTAKPGKTSTERAAMRIRPDSVQLWHQPHPRTQLVPWVLRHQTALERVKEKFPPSP